MSHFAVLVIGAKNETEIDAVLDRFWDLDLDTEALIDDYRSEFMYKLTKEEAEEHFKKYNESCPTQEQFNYAHTKLLQDKVIDPSDKLGMLALKNEKEPIDEEKFKNWLEKNKFSRFNVMEGHIRGQYYDMKSYITDWYSYSWNEEEKAYGHWSNPNEKWDWFKIGGRWADMFALKDDKKRCDIAKVKDIDFDKMENFGTYAVLKDGIWYERGEMGGFGVGLDEKNKKVWDEEFAKLIKDLDPDTYLAIVDCHI